MKAQINKIKTHVKEHKDLYIGVGVGVVIGATAVTLLKCRAITVANAELVQNVTQVNVGWGNTQAVINLIERSTPSKPVHLVGTNKYFASLGEAARETGHSLAKISRNVNGHIPDVGGDVFELLEKVA